VIICQAADLTQPTDKRTYKGTFPTCHAFSEVHGKPEESLRLLKMNALFITHHWRYSGRLCYLWFQRSHAKIRIVWP